MTATRRQFLAASAAVVVSPVFAAESEIPVVLVVTDPLSKELSCPCVEGYAQRDYTALGKFLEGKLGRPVTVVFSESLPGALSKKTAGKVDLVIGKDSVLRAHAKDQKLELKILAALTGLEGDTTQTGLIVVPGHDAALSADGLKGYRILFGPAAAEEKNAAPKELLKDLNVSYIGEDKDIAATCTVCATKVLEHAKAGEKVAGVISSYALAILEGCGTIKKGDLRVVGKTDPVPFISVFANSTLPADLQTKVKAALLDVIKDEKLCKVMETKKGFVEPEDAAKKK